ncbi:unnamed protein product, partial [marine sediment metagenome]
PIIDMPAIEENVPDNAVDELRGEEGALEGMELDEEDVRVQQVVDQVGDMVKDDPVKAGKLVQRWIQSSG